MTDNTTTTTSFDSAPHNSARRPCILSLDELQIQITNEVYDYLAAPFRTDEDDDEEQPTRLTTTRTDSSDNDNCITTTTTAATIDSRPSRQHSSKSWNKILQRMKIPPKTTILRVTRPNERQDVLEHVQMSMEEWIHQQQHNSTSTSSSSSSCQVKFHPIVSDIIKIDIIDSSTTTASSSHESDAVSFNLYSNRVPPTRPLHCTPSCPLLHNGNDTTAAPLFSQEQWPWRANSGWPCTHYVVIVDRLCGEAVLRGSDIFVRGILVADANIVTGNIVAVYADLERIEASTIKTMKTTRGQHLQHYTGHAVFLGLGTAVCSRALFFSQSSGLGVRMSALPWQRAGPVLPPFMMDNNSKTTSTTLSQLLTSGRVHAQNLPSALVAHILDPQPGQVTFDMCAAPGGKTSHVAQLILQQLHTATATTTTTTTTTIVMADKSRKKVLQARDLFRRLLGANGNMITPLHLDSTNCVERRQDILRQSVQEILSTAEPSPKDGLLQVTRFFPESFHRILLDPPCSALGLRPKLKIPQQTVQELKSLVNYQQCFVREAIHLLQVDGILTYSTCTVNYYENEGMVHHILQQYPCMELLPIPSNLGGHPGLRFSKEFLDSVGNGGLSEIESSYVRRFGCTDDPNDDTIGFFIAKFRKRYSMNIS